MESLNESRAEPLLNTTFTKIKKTKRCIVLTVVQLYEPMSQMAMFQSSTNNDL